MVEMLPNPRSFTDEADVQYCWRRLRRHWIRCGLLSSKSISEFRRRVCVDILSCFALPNSPSARSLVDLRLGPHGTGLTEYSVSLLFSPIKHQHFNPREYLINSIDSFPSDYQSTSQGPSSVIKRYRPYFSVEEVLEMIRIQSGKLPLSRIEAIRQQACVFIDKVGSRLGFPRRTIACAQLLYHRFHLFFSFTEFNPYDVSIAALWLASKLEDTIKKLREIQLVAWLIRNIQEGGNGLGEPKASIIDSERHRLSGIERLLLETVCFDFGAGKPFGARDVFGYVVGVGQRMCASQALLQLSFRLAIDSHRTLVGLTFPPHVIALACLYLASFLQTTPEESARFGAGWWTLYEAEIEDIDDICHQILDLLISLSSALRSNQSPSSPSDTKPMRANSHVVSHTMATPCPGAAELTRLKICLREIENDRRERQIEPVRRQVAGKAMNAFDECRANGKEWLGRDDVTVRFIFGDSVPVDVPLQNESLQHNSYEAPVVSATPNE
ncbi:hypothetical protein O181_016067 [Austropuccinia psidii MF-1]|uniref:Cyclin-like domain-containing protein n=1 Tax=Austropuccinia psidii MF-1 TaxID=1389203 RepID=A0A9Q3GRB9_9BASI|nr:hypothetical protein [Austropuccinia psidii MF-1]